MKNPSILIIACLIFALAFVHCTDPVIPAPQTLKTEYKVNPLGIDNEKPRFFWEIPNEVKGTMQSAYQILVATTEAALTEAEADVWNSGKVSSDQNIQIAYAGKPLQSSTKYYWKVKFWDQDDVASPYSEVGTFETALMREAEWTGKWIYNRLDAPENEAQLYGDIPAPLFRKEFQLDKEVQRARLYITGLGYYEAYINGEKTGDYLLNPGWTNYAKRIQYSTYDVTNSLKAGDNAIGVLLGNGWYNSLPLPLFNRFNLREILTTGQPKFVAQLLIEFEDGSSAVVNSDESWKTGDSPILRNNVYLGEKYDARLEQAGWDQPGFDEANWTNAEETTSPGGRMLAQVQAPIRITREVKPVAITELSPGVYIFDMGQNFAGNVKLKVNGPAGTEVQMRHAELLHEDGSLNISTTVACHIMEGSYIRPRPGMPKNADQKDTYILKGGGEETYSSRFTFHGFRYVELTGFPGEPDLNTLTGQRMNSDLAQIGEFESSNELFNQIQENIRWTFLSNVFSVESDCPGREKFGYGGDIVTAGEAYFYNYDMADFYTKTARDFQDDQRPSGGMPECAPDNAIYDEGLTKDTGPIGWMIAHPFLLENMVRYYGDLQLVEEQYEAAKRLTDFIAEHAPDYVVDVGISDHGTLVEKDEAVTGTAFFYYCAGKMAEFAEMLQRTDDAKKYAALAEQVKTTFVKNYLNPETGRIGKGTQACQNFALYYDLIPEEQRPQVLSFLLDSIKARDYHNTSGIFGTKFLYHVLDETGENETAFQVSNRRDFPSFGYMIENDATTLWESWGTGGKWSSHNHPMYGSISEWFFKSLGGINAAENARGMNVLDIRPAFVGDLSWVNASYHSVRGIIRSNWKMEDGEIALEIYIPGNTRANVHLPTAGKITVDGEELDASEFVSNITKTGEGTVFELAPGEYSIRFAK